MAKHIVNVGGYDHEINVIRLSKTVWLATGIFMDETLREKGRSEESAARKWAELANYLKRAS